MNFAFDAADIKSGVKTHKVHLSPEDVIWKAVFKYGESEVDLKFCIDFLSFPKFYVFFL